MFLGRRRRRRQVSYGCYVGPSQSLENDTRGEQAGRARFLFCFCLLGKIVNRVAQIVSFFFLHTAASTIARYFII